MTKEKEDSDVRETNGPNGPNQFYYKVGPFIFLPAFFNSLLLRYSLLSARKVVPGVSSPESGVSGSISRRRRIQ